MVVKLFLLIPVAHSGDRVVPVGDIVVVHGKCSYIYTVGIENRQAYANIGEKTLLDTN